MKSCFFKNIAGLTLVAIAISIPTVTFAASPTPEAKTTSSPKPETKTTADPQPTVLPDDLKLTADQKKKIADILADRSKQIEAILTAEQLPKYKEAMKKKEKLTTVLTSLKLTADQKTKLKTVTKTTNEQIKAVLTPQQLEAIQKAKK